MAASLAAATAPSGAIIQPSSAFIIAPSTTATKKQLTATAKYTSSEPLLSTTNGRVCLNGLSSSITAPSVVNGISSSATLSTALTDTMVAAVHQKQSQPTGPKIGPLSDIRILDFTRIIAGPFATMLLADLGAEVWKVERPKTGDDSRMFKPPSVNGESCYFMSFNRNKKSIVIDIKTNEGRRLIEQLAMKADVLVENFQPKTMDRLKIGYEQLKKIAPHLIFCSISGYGPKGPWADRGGFDVVAAAIGGFLNITGSKDGDPVKAGIAVTDLMTAQYAHGAIMAALLHRYKTGVGQKIDCSLLATQIAALTNIGNGYLNTLKEPCKWGTDHETIVPYRGFQTKDNKWLVVGAANDRMWCQFCEIIDMPELLKQPEFSTNMARVQNRDRFLTKTLKEWSALFERTPMPFGPVNDMAGAFSNPQVVYCDMVKEVEHPIAGTVRLTGPAVTFSESDNSVRTSPPLLGEHTCEILHKTLGLTNDEMIRLRREQIIDFPDSN